MNALWRRSKFLRDSFATMAAALHLTNMAKKGAAKPPAKSYSGLQRELKKLLDGEQAHASFDDAVKGLPAKLRGIVPQGLPYSAWQIVEHIRIAQRDILDFSRNSDGSYKPMKWPDDYWPKQPQPSSAKAWDETLRHIKEDRTAFEELLASVDDQGLVIAFHWGEGQTFLREALLIADHVAYHTGELIVIRRLLGAWK
jgi:uncharacterized damage-inducible protein DinB